MRRKRKFRVFDYKDNIGNKEYKAINDLKEIDKTMIEINEKLNNIFRY